MKNSCIALASVLALTACKNEKTPDPVDPGASFERFISVDDVAADPSAFTILDVRSAESYAAGHIDGAINAPWQTFADVANGAPGDPAWGILLPPTDIAAALGALGVDTSKQIVTYADPVGWGEDGRVSWSLQSIGLDTVRLLDGGLPAWVNTGHDVTTDVPATTPTTVEVTSDEYGAINVTTDEMLAAVEAGDVVIIDARAAIEYDGAMDFGEARGGHIPGAISIPFTENLNGDGTLKPEADLVAMYEAVGASPDAVVYVYCTKGIRSAYTHQVLTDIGFDARNYDASFYAWAGDATLPIE